MDARNRPGDRSDPRLTREVLTRPLASLNRPTLNS
jgi:hypothetical protein